MLAAATAAVTTKGVASWFRTESGRVVRVPTLLPVLLIVAFLLARKEIWLRNRTMMTENAKQPHHSTSTIMEMKKILKSSATMCKEPTELNKGWFMSQSNEDEELLKWFKNLCGGTYLEMGALNGIRYSNSYIFFKALDWKGVLIEASPINYKSLVKNRPRELATIHAGVCAAEQDLHWVEGDASAGEESAVGGFQEFAAPTFQASWWTPAAIAAATVVKCKPLTTLLEEEVHVQEYFFDFFSLDIEGAEYVALKSLDFDRFQFGIIFLEADSHNPRKNLAARTLLELKGYTFLQLESRSYWFINRHFHDIYEDLIYG